MKEVNNQNLWNFELGSQESMNVPIWRLVGLQQRDRKELQNLNNDTFSSLPVASAQCILGRKKPPDAGILINYIEYDYSQSYGLIKEAFRALAKDDILQPCISDHDFRSSNVRADDIGYILYLFEKRCQETFTVAQPIKLISKLDGLVPNDINGYALLLKTTLVIVSSDGQRPFDLIQP